MQKKLKFNDEDVIFEVLKNDGENITISLNGKDYKYQYQNIGKKKFSLTNSEGVDLAFADGDHIVLNGKDFFIKSSGYKRGNKGDGGSASMKSPMPGKILKILAKEGERVEKGTGLLVMEAMKMEHTIAASSAGTVTKFLFQEDELVQGGVDLVEFSSEEKE